MNNSKVIYVIAGEASGDFIGSLLIKKLKELYPNILIKGIGGEKMEAEGLKSLFHIKEIAIMGFFEVLKKAFTLRKLINKTVEDIINTNPDIVITIDSLGFNKRVVKKVKNYYNKQKNSCISIDPKSTGELDEKENNKKYKVKIPKFVHYVAPSVWAWKPKRAKELAEIYDYLLCLFDFEIPYFEKEKLKTFSVGHPIVESQANEGKAENFYNKYKEEKEDTNYILLMPGSRVNEVTKLLPIFLEVANNLKKTLPNLKIILPTLPYLKNTLDNYLKFSNIPYKIIIDNEDKINSFKVAKLALAASGTVSLELALAKIPTIIAYRVNFFTALLARLLIKVKYASIINIIANEEIIKEFLQEKCKVDNLTDYAKSLINTTVNEEIYNNKILPILESLGYQKFKPSEKAANIIVEIIENKI